MWDYYTNKRNFNPLCFFFIQRSPKIKEFLYPNPLFNNGTFSDMVIENDDKIHFGIRSYKPNNSGPTYALLDFRKNAENIFYYEAIKPTTGFIDQYQIRIILDSDNKPMIYYYYLNSWGFFRSRIYILDDEEWKFPSFFNPTLRLITNGPLLNWFNFQPGITFYSSIYQEPRISYYNTTPILYMQNSSTVHFLNSSFIEIQNAESYAPGDFQIIDTSLAILWTKYENSSYSHPYLTIKWAREGWKIYKLGNELENHFLARAIIPYDNVFNVFYYDNGEYSNDARLFLEKFYNSSYSTKEEITSFNGEIFFYDESITMVSPDCFAFLYSKSSYEPDSQFDLYLGIYNSSYYREIQLTDTPNYSEYWANCETGNQYLHFTWGHFGYEGTNTVEWHTTSIFYNRILISDLNNLEKIEDIDFITLSPQFGKNSSFSLVLNYLSSSLNHKQEFIIFLSTILWNFKKNKRI